jgi:hypothetical protein
MNLVLNSHPKIWSLDEDVFFLPSLYVYLFNPKMPPYVAFKLPEYAHMVPFIKMLPDPRVIWCIRDPLDAVWSMLALQLDVGGITAPWAAHTAGGWGEIMNSIWVLSDEQKSQLAGPMKEFQRLTNKFVGLSQSNKDLTGLIERKECAFMAALCWRIKNELPALYKAQGVDFHVARYEEIVTSPKERIAEILAYIGVDWDDKVLMHHRLHEGVSIGNTSNRRAIDKSSVGKGKKNLTQEEQDLIKSICHTTAKMWNYAFD